MNPCTGGFLNIAGGFVNLYGAEKLTNVDIASTAGLALLGDGTSIDRLSNMGLLVSAGSSRFGDIDNDGNLALLAETVAAAIENRGTIFFNGNTTADSLVNFAGGNVAVLANMNVAGAVNNKFGGAMMLGADITAGSTFTNDGLLLVVGDVTDEGEQAGTRYIKTTGFWV